VHLREIAHPAVHRRSALFDPCIPHRHKAPVYAEVSEHRLEWRVIWHRANTLPKRCVSP
jgi:hypothetical protein